MVHEEDGAVVLVETIVFEGTHDDSFQFGYCFGLWHWNVGSLVDRLWFGKSLVACLTMPTGDAVRNAATGAKRQIDREISRWWARSDLNRGPSDYEFRK